MSNKQGIITAQKQMMSDHEYRISVGVGTPSRIADLMDARELSKIDEMTCS